jgi:hypothetical protein
VGDEEIEIAIRRAGYDVRWEPTASGARAVYALRDGKRHTRAHPTLLALAQYLGRVERPVQFVEDGHALEAALLKHAEERQPFVVRRESCRIAIFRSYKYVQLVSAAGYAPAMYEVSNGGVRRTSNGNLPLEVVAAFAAVDASAAT